MGKVKGAVPASWEPPSAELVNDVIVPSKDIQRVFVGIPDPPTPEGVRLRSMEIANALKHDVLQRERTGVELGVPLSKPLELDDIINVAKRIEKYIVEGR